MINSAPATVDDETPTVASSTGAFAGPLALVLGTRTDDEDPDIAELKKLLRRLDRTQAQNRILETMIEDRTQSLVEAHGEVRSTKHFLEAVMTSIPSAVFVTGLDGTIASVGGASTRLSGFAEDELVGDPIAAHLRLDQGHHGDPDPWTSVEGAILRPDGREVAASISRSRLAHEDDRVDGWVYIAADVSDRKRLEVDLRQAQRLEAVGQLAAGIAHEINTPIQFIADSVHFLGEVIADLTDLATRVRGAYAVADDHAAVRAALREISDVADEVDLDFLLEEAPNAVDRTLHGVDRVSTIVRALKRFSHPGGDEPDHADVNDIVETTLTVARSEYRDVAEVDVELGTLPEVPCHTAELGQALLNLIVNATHAIAAHLEGTGEMGRISVRTAAVDDGVVIEVGDTGGGIPEEIRERIFDPFFTTKDQGRGSGQGLAISHAVVVERHGGRLSFDVEDGVGTTFRIWLPGVRTG